MTTPVFCCGFECYWASGTVGAHWTGTAAPFSFDTGTVRSGSRSMRANFAGALGNVFCNQTTATIQVVRVYVRFATLPNTDTYLLNTTNTIRMGIAFKQSDSKLYCATGNTPTTMGATGVSVTTGVWYRLDLKFDQTSGSCAMDAKVDGATLTQVTHAGTGTAGVVRLGSGSSAPTGEWFYDDFLLSNTSGDYPIGAGYVNHFVPTSDGTHNITNAGDFKVGAAGANITNSTTDSYLLVDDVPMDDTTPDTNDYINQSVNTGGDSEYVEHVFGPASGISTPTQAPRAVEVIVAYHGASAAIADSTFKLNDNGTEDTIFAFSGTAATTIKYARKHYATAPTGGAWTLSGAGNFNNLRHRFGYSTDANPDQYFDCAMIEAEFVDAANTTLVADSGSFAVSGTAAGLLYNRVMSAASGSFAVTGTNATFSKSILLASASGSFSISGTAATFLYDRILTTSAGSYVVTGTAATLTYTPNSNQGNGFFGLL